MRRKPDNHGKYKSEFAPEDQKIIWRIHSKPKYKEGETKVKEGKVQKSL
jgi:hypothetical protein